MKVLVCGDRNFTNFDLFCEIMNNIPLGGDDLVINGAARGADKMSTYWAEGLAIPVKEFPADWTKYGKAAGPIRNKQMLDEGKPDLVVAFLAPNSKGTKNMIEQAEKAGVPVKVIDIASSN